MWSTVFLAAVLCSLGAADWNIPVPENWRDCKYKGILRGTQQHVGDGLTDQECLEKCWIYLGSSSTCAGFQYRNPDNLGRCYINFKITGKVPNGDDENMYTAYEMTCIQNLPPAPGPCTVNIPHSNLDGMMVKYNKQIKVQCEEGYKIDGKSTLVCGDDGKFNPAPPTCKEGPGPCTVNIPHSNLDGMMVQYNKQIKVQCEEGYKIDGKSTLVCGEDGKFNPAPPTCKEASCTWELAPATQITGKKIEGCKPGSGFNEATARTKCEAQEGKCTGVVCSKTDENDCYCASSKKEKPSNKKNSWRYTCP